MGFTFSTDSYKSYADNNAKKFEGYSSFSENFAASVGQGIDEELSISSMLNDEGISSRNQQIRNMVSDGKIDKELFDSYSKGNPSRGSVTDYNSLVEYLNWSESLDEKLPTDQELIDARNEELALKRKYRESVFDTALTGGKVAQFLGGFVASGLDPINIASMAVAAPMAGARAVSKSMYALVAARNNAALNVGVSIPIEPFVHSWKEEIGAEYTIANSFYNIAASGVLGGLVGGVAGRFSRGFGVPEKETIEVVPREIQLLLEYDGTIKGRQEGESRVRLGISSDKIMKKYPGAIRISTATKPNKIINKLKKAGFENIPSSRNVIDFMENMLSKNVTEIWFKNIQDLQRSLKILKIDSNSPDIDAANKFLSGLENSSLVNPKFIFNPKNIKSNLIDQGLDEDDASTITQFLSETQSAHNFDPNLNAEDFVRKAEESQEGMDAGNKSDFEPNENYDDDEFLKAQFDRPEVAEGEIQKDTRDKVPADNNIVMEDGTIISFREASEDMDTDIEDLVNKLDCLNG